MSNHLAKESSPYLLQHVENPVEWYPWCEEALQRARSEQKPILLSIGYAACHWCHVMAHESFEDAETARLMNQWFINVKVDREERPDIDSIYMSAVTSMTGHGGWPMTVFLTPDGEPFYCGTYFPRESRLGMPAFSQVLTGVAEAWQSRRAEVRRTAENIALHLNETRPDPANTRLEVGILDMARHGLRTQFDSEWGGFGSAPKFPQPMVLDFLLREHLRMGDPDALVMVTTTLRRMAQGGMYDQLGGGFARYSTDRQWLVPHFEKMLYDNAQLARLYLRAFQVSGDEYFRHVAEETLDYLLREMQHVEGGFYSSQDADSEGEEGKFFVWSAAEIRDALGEDAELFMRVYGVRDAGNWEGKNVLHLGQDVETAARDLGLNGSAAKAKLNSCRDRMFKLRSRRTWPGLDDKVLTAWNGLAMGALAEAGRVLERADYLAAAEANAEFLHATLKRDDGRLLRTWKAGSGARFNAYLEDYACLAEALLSLYEANFDTRWYSWAVEIGGLMLKHFSEPGRAGFFDTSDDHETLILRPRDVQDNAMPSGGSRAAMALFRLGLYAGDTEWIRLAGESVKQQAELMQRYPSGFGEWLNLASFILGNPRELALLGPLDQLGDLISVVNERYRPNLVVAAGTAADSRAVPLLHGRSTVEGRPAAYLCRNFTCQAPVTQPAELRRLLDQQD